MPRIIIIFLFSILLGNLTSGCWDKHELEYYGYVQAIGLDPGKDPKSIKVTALVSLTAGSMEGGGASGGGENQNFIIATREAPSIYEGLNLINTSLNREITLLQNSVLVINQKLAQKGIARFLDSLTRYREVRRTLLLFISQKNTFEILQIQPKFEKSPSGYFVNTQIISSKTALFPITNLNDFLIRYESLAQENYIPLVNKCNLKEKSDSTNSGSEGKNGEATAEANSPEVCVNSTAIFVKDKMIGRLNIYENQLLLLLTGEFKQSIISVPDPLHSGKRVILRLMKNTPLEIEYRQLNGADHLAIALDLEANVLDINSPVDYTAPKNSPIIEKHAAKILNQRIRELITKTQQQFRADIFGFGRAVTKRFWTTAAWQEYNWPSKYPEAKINIQVSVAIRRVGMQFAPVRPHR